MDEMNSPATANVQLPEVDAADLLAELQGWREKLADLLQELPPDSFERLILSVLEKEGIHDIEVSRSGEKLAGIGHVGSGGFLSFRVAFRCLRGRGRINSAEVEDFRRELQLGRADKGLLISTDSFTQEAQLKAASERIPEINLVDSAQLIDTLKALQLGLRSERVIVERVLLDEAWFGQV